MVVFGLTSILSVLHNATMPHVKITLFKKTGQQTEELGFSSRSLIVIIAFSIVLLVAIGIAVYFYIQYQQTQTQLNRTTQSNEQAALLNQVGKLIVLPSGEQPQIATVTDMSKLKGQSFFARAHNGDKVLIYSKAQQAILYDPIANKIVEVGPINLTQVTPTVFPALTSAPVNVALYNGTGTVGLTETIAQELKQKLPQVTVISRTNAEKSTYTSTIVIDQTGKNTSTVATLAKLLNGNVGKLPVGEAKAPKADILVILGK
jgi:hypothetical protein